MNIEIFDKQRINKKFTSDSKYLDEYKKHLGYGASGCYDSKTKIGQISSYAKICKLLILRGYANLGFCNGGDDDWLVVDHDAKEFGFFEDNSPTKKQIQRAKTLIELWKNT